jgi:signal transduction histidine kinase
LFTTSDGLPNNNIVGILPDEFGYLWLSTDKGLCRFHPAENSFISYYVQDELPHNEFNRMASLKASDGRLYFGGLNGLTAFYPGDVDTSLNHFQPILISYSMFRSEKDSIYTYDGSQVNQHPIVFTHKDQLFNFRFMLPAYREPEKNRFLYKLQGWDKEWQNSGQSNVISYSYLPPGDYTLLVKGAASGDTWSRREYRLQIIVQEAWYKTWWSITLAALALGGIFYTMYRYRLNQVLHVQQIRNKISADLHDELGSVLTQISLQSDMVSRDIYTEEEKQHELENIRNTSREAILAMSDIVWSVSAGHDKASSLIDRMKDHADLMLQPLDIVPEFIISGIREDRVIDNQLRQELFLIFKEAIHNIVKHASPTYVKIDMHNEDGLFELNVKNDINTPREKKAVGGHGLKNMKQRAETIGATLEVEAGDNSYTVILRRREI